MSASAADPTTEQLLAFAESLLSSLGPHLRERAALEHAIADHTELWVMLYRASVELDSD